MPSHDEAALKTIDELRLNIVAGKVRVQGMDYEPGCDGVNRLWFDLRERMEPPPWISSVHLDGSTGDCGHDKRAGSKGVGG